MRRGIPKCRYPHPRIGSRKSKLLLKCTHNMDYASRAHQVLTFQIEEPAWQNVKVILQVVRKWPRKNVVILRFCLLSIRSQKRCA